MESPSRSSARRWYRNPDVYLPLLLVTLGIAFFGDVLFTSKNFYFRDILNFHYPLRKVMIDAYVRGEWPLWNPFVYLGQPMLANPNYLAFYPSNLFHLIFPFNYAFKLHFVIHPVLGGLGAYFLLRRLGIAPLAAFGGASVYQLSGTVLSFLNLYNLIPAVGLMPWIGWAFLRSLGGRATYVLLFGVIIGIQGFAPEPLLILCEMCMLTGLAALHIWEAPRPAEALKQVLKNSTPGILFGLGLAAVQILPTLELMPRSVRGSGFEQEKALIWSMHPFDLLNTIVPNLFGDPYTIGRTTYWGEAYHRGREGYLVSYFLGMSAVLLSLLSLGSERRRTRLVFFCLVGLGVFLALGQYNPLFALLHEKIPMLQLGRYTAKFFLLATLGIAVLASLGIETLMGAGGATAYRRRTILLAAAGALTVAGVSFALWIYLKQNPQISLHWVGARLHPALARSKDFGAILPSLLFSIRWTGQFALLTILVILPFAWWKRPSLAGWIAGLLVIAELAPANLRLCPLISDADVDFVPEVNRYLGARGGPPCRVIQLDSEADPPVRLMKAPNRSWAWLTLFFRRAGQPMDGIISGIQYSLFLSVDRLNTADTNALFVAFSRLLRSSPAALLQRTNTCTVLTVGDIVDPRVRLSATFDTQTDRRLSVYDLQGALPRAYFVSGVRRVGSHEDALRLFTSPDFPAGEAVILEEEGAAEEAVASGVVRVTGYQNSSVSCEVSADSGGYVVLLDSYYPGWSGFVDGREVAVRRANYAFRAVKVPAGRHRVDFRYQPASFWAGLVISCLTLGLALVLTFCNRR